MRIRNHVNFTVTEHAKKRCMRRKIQPEWIRNALNYPVRIESDSDDGSLVHAKIGVRTQYFMKKNSYPSVTAPAGNWCDTGRSGARDRP